MRRYYSILLLYVILFMMGCANQKIFKAFDGAFQKGENNKIINDYCTSCHIHNKFIADEHVRVVSQRYTEVRYKNSDECRTCHYLKTSILNGMAEKTIYP